MGFKDYVFVRPDVLDPSYDDKLAPEIDEVVLGIAPLIYSDPVEFFKRTYPTQSIRIILEEIASVLREGSGRKIYPLVSLFGGGKTHTLLTIYHALRNPDKVYLIDRELGEKYKDLERVDVIVVHGKTDSLAPIPPISLKKDGVVINTLWGYVAYKLGQYDVIKEFDKKLLIPGKDVLRRMLSGRRVVILIDEIGEYIKRIKSSRMPNKWEYIDQVVLFIDYLAEAVESTDNILLITFPIEAEANRIKSIQEGYEPIARVLREIFIRIFRVAGNVYVPVTGSGELYSVLRKRLFEKIDMRKASRELEELFSIYREYPGVFGDTSGLENEVKSSYPFHPEYLSIIWLIADKITGQKTRTAMKISRIVIRQLMNSSENPVLIMPWHIDPAKFKLYGLLFHNNYQHYQMIYEKDIVGGTRQLAEKKDLAYVTALTIFLKTYPYDSLVVHRAFPDRTSIALSVYEPEFFRRRGYTPTDIETIIDTLRDSPTIYHLNSKDGRYWFSRIPTVKEWIENEAKKLLSEERNKLEAMLVKEYVEKLLVSRYVKPSTRRRGEGPGKLILEAFSRTSVFSEDSMYAAISTYDIDVPDNDRYKLVAILDDTPDNIRKLLTKYHDKVRTYRNTVVAVTLSDPSRKNLLIEYLARVKAAEKIINTIDDRYKDYSREIREIQKSIARNYKFNYESMLITSTVTFFDKIYYPTMIDSSFTVKHVIASSSETSISERVTATLSQGAIGKIVEEMSFEGLESYLRRAGSPIEPGRARRVGDIVALFKTNPMLPMVREDAVKLALKEGVELLKIGLVDELGKLYFKKIYGEKDIEIHRDRDRGFPPNVVRDSYEAIHWRDAINKLLEEIREDIERESGVLRGDKYVKVEYYVFYKGSWYPIEGIEKLSDWMNIVRYGFIVKKTREITVGFILEVEPRNIEIGYGEKVKVTVKVRSLGGYRDEVEIDYPREIAVIEGPSKGIPDYTTSIVIDGSRVRESGIWEIKGIDKHGREHGVIINIKLKKDIIDITRPGDLREGDILLRIGGEIDNPSIFDDLEKLEEILGSDKIVLENMELELFGEYGRANVGFNDTKPSIAIYSVKTIMPLLGKTRIGRGGFDISVREKEVDQALKNILASILRKGNGKIRVQVKRRRT